MTIFGWIWRGVVLFVILTIVYVILTLTNRLKEKDRLRAAYASAETALSEKEYVTMGMGKYNRSLRAKLVLGVYLVPLAIGAFLTYLAQYT